ncbi:hypothetical protein DOTSEDRAFT_136210, partial [Dothistroma septosporum NZE10]
PVHRVVLVSLSDWFPRACTGNFVESSSDKVELYDDDPDHIAAMLDFCYHSSYTEDPEVVSSSPILFSVFTFAIAEKYLIAPLQTYATDRLSYYFFTPCDSHIWPTGMASAITAAYSCTSDQDNILRGALVDYVATYYEEIFDTSGPAFQPIRDAARSTPEFAAEVLEVTA